MATVQTAGSTKARNASRPVISVKQSRRTKAVDAPLPGETPIVRQMAKINETVLVNALADAGGFHRDALLYELSVGLLHFGSTVEGTKVPLEAKKLLRETYAKAGYNCKTHTDEDYKTVARRIGVTADLYSHIGGRETLIDWLDEATPAKSVSRIVEELRRFNFDGINSVLAYMGKPVTVKRPRLGKTEDKKDEGQQMSEADKAVAAQMNAQEAERRQAEAAGIPPGRILSKGTVQVVVPFNATYDDVMALALELMTFAKTQLPLPVEGQPAQAGAPVQQAAAPASVQ